MSYTRINLNNFGIISGRLVHDPVEFKEKDFTTYYFTIAAVRGYKGKNGKLRKDYIGVVGRANKKFKMYQYLKKGKEVRVTYTNVTYKTTDKNGKPQYRERKIVTGIVLGKSEKPALKDYPAYKFY